MFRILEEDQRLRTRSVLTSFCAMLRRILRERIYQYDEIGTIHCYLLRGVYADIQDGHFRIYYENEQRDQIMLGFVSQKRTFTNEVIDRYFQAIQ